MSEGVGIVEPRQRRLNLPAGGFKLASGGVLKEIVVQYEACGAPMRADNVIYVCHALTGDAHVAGIRPGEEKPSGWWEGMVGPGRAIDTNRYHVICANVLGGCSGTTGPMSINPDTGRPYGSSFPQYSFDDAIDVYRLLLKELGVTHLAALIGGSYGGLQVVNWMTRFPEDMDRVCLIATSANLNTQAIAFSVMSRNSITDDPAWKGGDYYEDPPRCGQGPRAGLAAARQLAHITYLSRELLQEKFHRDLQKNFVEAPDAERAERDRLFKTYFQIESYLDYQAMKFVRRFDANSYLHITRSMDLFDPADRFGSLDAAFARVTAKTLVCSYENDILFPDWQSKEIVASLMRTGRSVSYCHLESGTGHDSFLTDIEHLSKVVGGFLTDRPVKVMKWQERHYRNVVKMVRPGARVIDIGCGDGMLLDVLREHRKTVGTGVELDIERYEEAIADGHEMLFDDVDDGGIECAPDHRYDVAIVSDTLQEVKNPRGLLHEALRLADEAIVTFPNFAAYRIRLTLALTGRLPVSKQLPFQWYDTPNIHCITLKDFRSLCEKENIEILEVKAESRHFLGKVLMFLGFKNLGASKIVARIARKTS